MDARSYWGTTKRLSSQYRREADAAAAKHEAEKQQSIAADAAARNDLMQNRAEKLAAAWHLLKPGDAIPGTCATIKRKSKYSVTSESGTRYTVEEVIGSRAAAIVRRP